MMPIKSATNCGRLAHRTWMTSSLAAGTRWPDPTNLLVWSYSCRLNTSTPLRTSSSTTCLYSCLLCFIQLSARDSYMSLHLSRWPRCVWAVFPCGFRFSSYLHAIRVHMGTRGPKLAAAFVYERRLTAWVHFAGCCCREYFPLEHYGKWCWMSESIWSGAAWFYIIKNALFAMLVVGLLCGLVFVHCWASKVYFENTAWCFELSLCAYYVLNALACILCFGHPCVHAEWLCHLVSHDAKVLAGK